MLNVRGDQSFGRKVILTVAIVLLALLLILLVYFTLDVLLLIFSSVLLAILLRGIADLLRRYLNVSEVFSVLLVTVLLVGLLAGAIAVLAPDVAEQARHLREELPKSATAAANYISQYSWGRTLVEQLPSLENAGNVLNLGALLAGVGGFFSSTIGTVGNFFVVVLLAIYLACEPRTYVRGFTNLFPLDQRTRVREIIFAVGETLQWWLVGKVGSMLFIGLLTWIGLYLIGVPLALTLGLIAALLSFIPNFGPIISALPALLLAFIPPGSPMKALYVLILYVGVQVIESNLVTPFIERKTVEIPPALTIIFQLALAVLVGWLGLVLATPLLAVFIVVIEMVYIEDVLGDRRTDVLQNIGPKTIEHGGESINKTSASPAPEKSAP
jgi:predicted PurR-regulated permease PerM